MSKFFQPDLYLCTPIKVDKSKNYYIVGFEPNSTMVTAHHILIYGCSLPGSSKSVWNCGEMTQQSTLSGWTAASPCSENSQVSYLQQKIRNFFTNFISYF